jgi:S1-C subfamily serine protease
MIGFKKSIMFLAVIFILLQVWPFSAAALTEDEENTIAVVKGNVNGVVFITNIQYSRDFLFGTQEVQRGTGTGFIWDSQGHIVTNYHVIEDGDAFMVTCPNQKNFKAKLIGKEPAKDIAVLRIEPGHGDFTPVRAGSSGELRVGQKVVAIGNPFGFDHTVTTGIVSALGRNIQGFGGVTIRNMVQTDASINPGNSGGPLLNSDGRLIGMNTMIYSRTGANTGIGFAVPVDIIKKIVPQLIKFGKVIRPGIGVSFLGDEYARRFNIEGAVIVDVPRNSRAFGTGIRGIGRDRAGRLYLGDVLVGIDDIKISSYDDMYNALDNYRIGDIVNLTFERNGKKRKIKFRLVEID